MINLNSPSINGQETMERAPYYILGLMKQFENNSSLQIIALNPFASNFMQSTTTINTSSLYQHSSTSLDLKAAIMISYSYNFKIGKDVKSNQRNTSDPQNGGDEKQQPMNLGL